MSMSKHETNTWKHVRTLHLTVGDPETPLGARVSVDIGMRIDTNPMEEISQMSQNASGDSVREAMAERLRQTADNLDPVETSESSGTGLLTGDDLDRIENAAMDVPPTGQGDVPVGGDTILQLVYTIRRQLRQAENTYTQSALDKGRPTVSCSCLACNCRLHAYPSQDGPGVCIWCDEGQHTPQQQGPDEDDGVPRADELREQLLAGREDHTFGGQKALARIAINALETREQETRRLRQELAYALGDPDMDVAAYREKNWDEPEETETSPVYALATLKAIANNGPKSAAPHTIKNACDWAVQEITRLRNQVNETPPPQGQPQETDND
jgi:hypothetical protein